MNSGGGVANCTLNQMRAAGTCSELGTDRQTGATAAGQLKEKHNLEEEEINEMEGKEAGTSKHRVSLLGSRIQQLSQDIPLLNAFYAITLSCSGTS